MRTRSYQQSYSSGDLAVSCICGYYAVFKESNSYNLMSPFFVQEVRPARFKEDRDTYVWKRCCPKCGNSDFINAKTPILDYISCFDNLANVRLVAQFSTYCHVSSQKAFRRTTHRFSICYNKKTHEAHLKFKGKLRQVNRILRQTNKGHIGKLDEMLRTIIKDTKYRDKVIEFKQLVVTHANLDSIYHLHGLATTVSIGSIQNVLTRAYYRTVNDLRCFHGSGFINSDIPTKIMKIFHDEPSTYDALSKICGLRISKPIYKQIDYTRQFFGLVLASRLTKNPDLILKLISNDRCHDNYYPGEACLSRIAAYVEHIGQANIDNAIKYSKLDCNIIAYIEDTLRLVHIIDRKHIPLPVFHSFRQYHDDLAYINRTVVNAPVELSFLTNDAIPIESTQGDYTFKVCRDTMTLRKLGEDLHSCVASYQYKVERGDTIIIDMQLEGKTHCCIEYDVNRFSIVQAKKNQAKNFGKPDEKTVEVIKKWVEQVEINISPNCRDLVKLPVHDHDPYYQQLRRRNVGMRQAHAANYMIQGQVAHEAAEYQLAAYHEAYPNMAVPNGYNFAQIDFAQAAECVLAGLQHDAIIQDEVGIVPNFAIEEDE